MPLIGVNSATIAPDSPSVGYSQRGQTCHAASGIAVEPVISLGSERQFHERRFGYLPWPGICGQFEVVKHFSRVAAQAVQLLGNRLTVLFLAVFEHTECEAAQTRHVLRSVAAANQTCVFIEGMRIVENPVS